MFEYWRSALVADLTLVPLLHNTPESGGDL